MFFTRRFARIVVAIGASLSACCVVCGGSRPSVSAECPRGALYLATCPDIRGACGVAFHGDRLYVATPEALPQNALVSTGVSRDVSTGVSTDVSAGVSAERASPLVAVDWTATSAIAGRLAGPEGETDEGAADTPALPVHTMPSNAACAVDVAVREDGELVVVDLAGVVWVGNRRFGEEVLEAPIAVAPLGMRLAVSDVRLRAVVILDAEGHEVDRLGGGQLIEPAGLALGSEGELFVADRLGHCLWRFRQNGSGFVAQGERIGTRGSGPGQFSAPRDVAVISSGVNAGCVLVADELNHRIQVLDATGVPQGFFGMHALVPRQGSGRIHYPRAIAVAKDGSTIAVAEAFEDRVQFLRLKSEADAVDPATGSIEYISSHFGAESGAAADLLVVVDVETQSIALLDARSTPPRHISIVGGSGALPGRFGEISALAVDAHDARIFVADRVRQRIDVVQADWRRDGQQNFDLFIPRLVRSIDLARVRSIGSVTDGRTELRMPDVVDMLVGEAAGGATSLLLLDRVNLGIIETDTRLNGGRFIPLPSDARWPEEFARHDDGTLFVVDPVASALFERRAGATEWITHRALGEHTLVRPTGVAAPGNVVVVTDAARDACIVWDGKSSRLVGERGGLDEQFFDPASIVATDLGWIVIDRGNHRFQRFHAKDGDPFAWNMTGGLGRYFDRKRRGSPGFVPPPTPSPRTLRNDEPAQRDAANGGAK